MAKKVGCRKGYKKVKNRCVPNWKKLEYNQWEWLRADYDFYVTKTKDGAGLDIFNAKIKDHDKAYISSHTHDSVKEAKKDAEGYK